MRLRWAALWRRFWRMEEHFRGVAMLLLSTINPEAIGESCGKPNRARFYYIARA
jgi:hypothetical protein